MGKKVGTMDPSMGPLWTNRHTRLKTLPFRNFVAGSNNPVTVCNLSSQMTSYYDIASGRVLCTETVTF